MKSVEQRDEEFLVKAFDPQQRKTILDEMTYNRPLQAVSVWIKVGVSSLGVMIGAVGFGGLDHRIVRVMALAAIFLAMAAFSHADLQAREQRVLLLKVIDRLQRESAASAQPTTAEAGPTDELAAS